MELRALISDNEQISIRRQYELLDKEHLEHPTHGVLQLQATNPKL